MYVFLVACFFLGIVLIAYWMHRPVLRTTQEGFTASSGYSWSEDVNRISKELEAKITALEKARKDDQLYLDSLKQVAAQAKKTEESINSLKLQVAQLEKRIPVDVFKRMTDLETRTGGISFNAKTNMTTLDGTLQLKKPILSSDPSLQFVFVKNAKLLFGGDKGQPVTQNFLKA